MPILPEHPILPTYGEFDRLIESVTGERAPLTARFVRSLFERTRRLRIAAKLETAMHAAIKEAVDGLAETYHANVKLEPQHEAASFSQVIGGPKYSIIPKIARKFANELIFERLTEFEENSFGTLGEGLFVITASEEPIYQARRWLDYIEQMKESELFLHFVGLSRELTILCRTFDLLDGLILKQ